MAMAPHAGEFVMGLGTDENFAGPADDLGRGTRHVGKKALSALSDWDKVTAEMGERVVSVFHKGKLSDGKVLANKSLSTGLDRETVLALNREGQVHQFDIPRNVYDECEAKSLIKTKNDYDWETGIYNAEVKFDKSISESLNKYKVE